MCVCACMIKCAKKNEQKALLLFNVVVKIEYLFAEHAVTKSILPHSGVL